MSVPEPGLAAFLRATGLAEPGEEGVWAPLAGGISSDIWRVSLRSGDYCVKRALARLKVAADWTAPVDRNAHEWAYMQAVDRIAPGHVPRPVAHDPTRGLFVMAWLPPDRNRLWKGELMDGRVDPAEGAAVGDLVGRIHAATADDLTIARRFATDATFDALRIEPYLIATARKHPEVGERLEAIAHTTSGTKRALVHGDVSPKNILLGADVPVLLDAECAWFGDPAFDLAFSLNHLAIKARVLPASRAALAHSFDALAEAYLARVDWEPRAAIEARAAALLPALALARVDGKSPLDYLDRGQQAALRAAALRALAAEPGTLALAKDTLLRD